MRWPLVASRSSMSPAISTASAGRSWPAAEPLILLTLQRSDPFADRMWALPSCCLYSAQRFGLGLNRGAAVGDDLAGEIDWQAAHADDIGDDIGGMAGCQLIDCDVDLGGNHADRDYRWCAHDDVSFR